MTYQQAVEAGEKEILDKFVKEAERRFRLSDWPDGHFRRFLSEFASTISEAVLGNVEKIMRKHLSGKVTDNLDIYNSIGLVQKEMEELNAEQRTKLTALRGKV